MTRDSTAPETMIRASADAFFGYLLDAWSHSADAIPTEFRNHYLSAWANAVALIVADYRASTRSPAPT
jgi:haloacetate dehalogenase